MKRLMLAGLVVSMGLSYGSSVVDDVRVAVEEHLRSINDKVKNVCVEHVKSKVIVNREGSFKHLSEKEAHRLCEQVDRKGRVLHVELSLLKEEGNRVTALVEYKVFNRLTGYVDTVVGEVELVKNGNGWEIVLK